MMRAQIFIQINDIKRPYSAVVDGRALVTEHTGLTRKFGYEKACRAAVLKQFPHATFAVSRYI